MYLMGEEGKPPLQMSLPQAGMHAGAEAAVSSLIAHYPREIEGLGQKVVVNMQACIVWILMNEQAMPILHGDILRRIVFGEMRIGVNEGVMLEGIAEAADLPAENVRTAHMFLGDLGRVAEIALSEGLPGLRSAGLRLLSPVKPMLAEMAEDPDDVLTEHGGETAIEFKLDGARIQIHRDGDAVRIFSRRLTDVTDSLPELVAFAKSLPASRFLLEGEVVAVDHGGRPLPFQDLMRRFRRVHGIEEASREIPLKLFLFDLLTVDGRDLVDAPYRERWSRLEALVPRDVLTPRTIARTKGEIEAFLQRSLEEGHEGLMAKALDAPYSVGKRGKKWFKIKPADRLDLDGTLHDMNDPDALEHVGMGVVALFSDDAHYFMPIRRTPTPVSYSPLTLPTRGLF